MAGSKKPVHEVFGVSNTVLPDSYVDRGALDAELKRLLGRPGHIALRGESKCGKSWLRQRNIPNALVVQCRLHKTVNDLYVDALSQLGIVLELEQTTGNKFKGSVTATASAGASLLAKIGFNVKAEGEQASSSKGKTSGHDVNDLRFVADLLREAGRRLVVEDFHYMSLEHRRHFAFDLKALWDYGMFVVVIGVWSLNNMLLFLNPDLSGRMTEVGIYWSPEDLRAVLQRGGNALNLVFPLAFSLKAIEICFGNVGILQTLVLNTLDILKIFEAVDHQVVVNDTETLEAAAMIYAEQLNPVYQQFATRVSNGIRTRRDSTGIYAHAMRVILAAADEDLIRGLHLNAIYAEAHARQPRIHKGNLRTVLRRFEELQVDAEGRGLVLSYNIGTSELIVVDRQLLLYRRYSTMAWPWEEMVEEADQSGVGFEGADGGDGADDGDAAPAVDAA